MGAETTVAVNGSPSGSVPVNAIVTAVSSKVLTNWATAIGASFTGAKVRVTTAALVPVGEESSPSETDTRNVFVPHSFKAGS